MSGKGRVAQEGVISIDYNATIMESTTHLRQRICQDGPAEMLREMRHSGGKVGIRLRAADDQAAFYCCPFHRQGFDRGGVRAPRPPRHWAVRLGVGGGGGGYRAFRGEGGKRGPEKGNLING